MDGTSISIQWQNDDFEPPDDFVFILARNLSRTV